MIIFKKKNIFVHRTLGQMHQVMTAMVDTGDIIEIRSLYFNVLIVTRGIAPKQV